MKSSGLEREKENENENNRERNKAIIRELKNSRYVKRWQKKRSKQ